MRTQQLFFTTNLLLEQQPPSSGSPVIPSYPNLSKVNYEYCMDDLHKHNANMRKIQRSHAEGALYRLAACHLGRQSFEDLRTANRMRQQVDENAAAWVRLREEGVECLSRR